MDGIIKDILLAILFFLVGTFLGGPIRSWFNKKLEKMEMAKSNRKLFKEVNLIMPELIKEISEDLKSKSHFRDFVLLNRECVFNGEIHFYIYEDHANLIDKITILENRKLISNITNNNVKRYRMTEEFVDLLIRHAL